MNVALLSSDYNVRRLTIADVQDIYTRCAPKTSLITDIVRHLSRNKVFLMI